MAAAAASGRSAPGGGRLSIGNVLDLLREEFPDLSHSKLHYLEAEGLIAPERTPSGYRKYSRDDVDRLVFVLRAQRDRFWPLKVIQEHLLEHGAEGSEVTSIASHQGPSAQLRSVRLDRRGLAREARVEDAFLEELEQYGLLESGLRFYAAAELEIVRSARTLADEGLHPRHLVMLRTSAEREAHMIDSVARPRSRRADAASRGGADEMAQSLGESMNVLHNALLRTRLRDR